MEYTWANPIDGVKVIISKNDDDALGRFSVHSIEPFYLYSIVI